MFFTSEMYTPPFHISKYAPDSALNIRQRRKNMITSS